MSAEGSATVLPTGNGAAVQPPVEPCSDSTSPSQASIGSVVPLGRKRGRPATATCATCGKTRSKCRCSGSSVDRSSVHQSSGTRRSQRIRTNTTVLTAPTSHTATDTDGKRIALSSPMATPTETPSTSHPDSDGACIGSSPPMATSKESRTSPFKLPADLKFNRAVIRDPSAYAREVGCASWLYLNGDEFASMPNGMSWAQVQAAVPQSARVISDPPRVLTLELAQQHVAALDALSRPTLISCRAGPRASAVAYLYAGLKSDASYDDVLAAAQENDAPFCAFPDYKSWLCSSMESMRANAGAAPPP